MSFDPRTMGTPVYEALNKLRQDYPKETYESRLKEQKGQAVELYTNIAKGGRINLKAEEKALKNQDGKVDVVKAYFKCLQDISGKSNLAGNSGLEALKKLGTEEYLGLTGLGLTIAQEFSFWATAVYHDVKGES
ncbi:MAG: hypothetical protein AAF329_23300 [Cyanobacteria bacterium P01_A01_bin.17]